MNQIICPLCGSTNYRYYYANTYLKDAKYYIRYVLCKDCNTAWQIPFMTKEIAKHIADKDIFYIDEYITKEPNYSDYIGGYHLMDLLRMENKLNKNVLEIGCGVGYLLKLCKDDGWEVFGIEPSRTMCLEAINKYGLKPEELYNGFPEDLIKPEYNKQYDMVVMMEVLEHLYNPIEVLKLSAQVVKPGGFLWIQTQLITDPHIPFTSDDMEPRYFKPQHPILPSWRQVEKILKELGFKAELKQPYNPSYVYAQKLIVEEGENKDEG